MIETTTCHTCEGMGVCDYRCGQCSGSGEGMADGTTCRRCKGSGEIHGECEDCDGTGVVEPEEDV